MSLLQSENVSDPAHGTLAVACAELPHVEYVLVVRGGSGAVGKPVQLAALGRLGSLRMLKLAG